jgi:hypothetical protein
MVTEAPGTAELWIAVHSDFHLFVNGRHFSRGASSAAGDHSYAHYYDIAFCMEIGRNVISVVAHNVNVIRSARERRHSGLWCQLNIDGQSVLATDGEWLTREADYYLSRQPRQSSSAGFVETVDLRRFPSGWTDVEFDSGEWQEADWKLPLTNSVYQLRALPDFEPSNEFTHLDFVAVRGSAMVDAATTHVSVPAAIEGAVGLFAAETWVNVDAASEQALLTYCDDPYHLFVNDVHVRTQGETARPASAWVDSEWNQPRPYMQSTPAPPRSVVQLQEGWNRILMVIQVGVDSNGATLVMGGMSPQTRFNRTTDAFSLPGWTVCGPLRVPFANCSSMPMLHRYQRVNYSGTNPCDYAAHCQAVAFQALEINEYDPEESDATPQLELGSGDYVVLTLPEYSRGCLELVVTGTAGDTVHLIYGDHLVDGRLDAHNGTHRSIYSLILGGDPMQFWHAVAPAGMKHVMVYVANSNGQVTIENFGVRQLRPSFQEQTTFNCADELLNQIWATSSRTLYCTWDQGFINSAGNPEGQLLADAMIQSLASLYVSGTAQLSEKALREFAEAQFETGEIPAIAPSDLVVRLLDFGLLWPVWLEHHVRLTDDRQLAEDMLPHLEMLLAFFESKATVDEVLIGKLEPPYDSPCLVDYDQSVDNRGVSTSLNALYCLSLLRSRWLFAYLGRDDSAQVCLRRASRLAQHLRDLTFDKERGLFADAWIDGKRSSSCSLQANTLALMAGIAEADHYQPMFSRMFLEYAPFVQLPVDHAGETPYFKYFITEMAFALNSRDWGMDLVRYYWGRMIQEGADAWFERFSTEVEDNLSSRPGRCHGYGVSPSIFMIREVIGIRPSETGYRQVYFNPLLTATEWARAQLSTAQGVISVDWAFNEEGELEIVIESSFPLEVIPLLDSAIADSATFHVSEAVTLLQPADEPAEAEAAEAGG